MGGDHFAGVCGESLICPLDRRRATLKGRRVGPPPQKPSPFGSTSATPPQGGSDTWPAHGLLPGSWAGWKRCSGFMVWRMPPGSAGVPPAPCPAPPWPSPALGSTRNCPGGCFGLAVEVVADRLAIFGGTVSVEKMEKYSSGSCIEAERSRRTEDSPETPEEI